jgi:hypothetical protein
MIAEGQHGRRAAVDAQLVFDRNAIDIVALARRAVGLEQELGHHEERDALDAFRRIRRPRQHEMDDVVRHVVLAVGDENLLTKDLVGAIAHRLGATAHGSQVGTGGRLGQVHRSGPFAGNEVRQVGRLLVIGTGNHQCLDGALGQHRAQREGMVGCLPHFADRRRQQTRQALAAEFRIATETIPAVIDKLAIGLLEARRGGNDRILPFGAVPCHRPD